MYGFFLRRLFTPQSALYCLPLRRILVTGSIAYDTIKDVSGSFPEALSLFVRARAGCDCRHFTMGRSSVAMTCTHDPLTERPMRVWQWEEMEEAAEVLAD